MPAEVLDEPLGISCVFSNGSRSQVTLGDTVNARLARDLLTGLAELIYPHGTVDAAGVCPALRPDTGRDGRDAGGTRIYRRRG